MWVIAMARPRSRLPRNLHVMYTPFCNCSWVNSPNMLPIHSISLVNLMVRTISFLCSQGWMADIRAFYIGGHYLPALASEIIANNKVADEKGLLHLPFESMLVGNGWTNPRSQFKYYEEYSCAHDSPCKYLLRLHFSLYIHTLPFFYRQAYLQ